MQNQGLRILLVEDEECACEILRSMLELKYPHATIYCAGDGVTGMDCIRQHQPDILISDINMPNMDGIRLLGSIPAVKPDIRVIVVTAHSDRKNLERISSTGISLEIVPKPVNFEVLFASIDRSIASIPHTQ